jgi:hypothetical protein
MLQLVLASDIMLKTGICYFFGQCPVTIVFTQEAFLTVSIPKGIFLPSERFGNWKFDAGIGYFPAYAIQYPELTNMKVKHYPVGRLDFGLLNSAIFLFGKQGVAFRAAEMFPGRWKI